VGLHEALLDLSLERDELFLAAVNAASRLDATIPGRLGIEVPDLSPAVQDTPYSTIRPDRVLRGVRRMGTGLPMNVQPVHDTGLRMDTYGHITDESGQWDQVDKAGLFQMLKEAGRRVSIPGEYGVQKIYLVPDDRPAAAVSQREEDGLAFAKPWWDLLSRLIQEHGINSPEGQAAQAFFTKAVIYVWGCRPRPFAHPDLSKAALPFAYFFILTVFLAPLGKLFYLATLASVMVAFILFSLHGWRESLDRKEAARQIKKELDFLITVQENNPLVLPIMGKWANDFPLLDPTRWHRLMDLLQKPVTIYDKGLDEKVADMAAEEMETAKNQFNQWRMAKAA
jgi:hypothetical protein